MRDLQEKDLSSPRPVKLGFLGLGWIGRKRLDFIASLPNIEIAALADQDKGCLDAASQAFRERRPQCVDHFEALLDCELDGIVIATPSALHAQQAIAALQRGLAVFCQKPLALTAADTKKVVAAAHASDRLLLVDYCYRYIKGMPELRERIRRGELGQLFAADLKFHNAYAPNKAWALNPELSGGGCLADLGVHLVDLLLWLLNEPQAEVLDSHLYSQGTRVPPGRATIEDFAFAQIRLANGAVARLACSWNLHAGQDAVIEVALQGSKAGAAWRNVKGSFYDFEVDAFHGAARESLGAYPDEWGGRAMTDWAQRLQQGAHFDPEALAYIKGAELIDACYGR